jgi:hypothetical protein
MIVWYSVFLENYIFIQLVKKCPIFVEYQVSSPCSWKSIVGLHTELVQSIPKLRAPFLKL